MPVSISPKMATSLASLRRWLSFSVANYCGPSSTHERGERRNVPAGYNKAWSVHHKCQKNNSPSSARIKNHRAFIHDIQHVIWNYSRITRTNHKCYPSSTPRALLYIIMNICCVAHFSLFIVGMRLRFHLFLFNYLFILSQWNCKNNLKQQKKKKRIKSQFLIKNE